MNVNTYNIISNMMPILFITVGILLIIWGLYKFIHEKKAMKNNNYETTEATIVSRRREKTEDGYKDYETLEFKDLNYEVHTFETNASGLNPNFKKRQIRYNINNPKDCFVIGRTYTYLIVAIIGVIWTVYSYYFFFCKILKK